MADTEGAPLVAITGSTGFIGRNLVHALPSLGYRVRVLLRRPASIPAECSGAVIGDLRRPENLSAALSGVSAIIHTAGLPDTMSGQPNDDFRDYDAESTRALAAAAARFRVRRFLFLSSLRAQVGTSCQRVVTEDMDPQPSDEYGRTKLRAELVLRETSIDWAALRLASVYGRGASGNVDRLLRVANSALPLPTAGIRVRRSLLALDNLPTAIATILKSSTEMRRAVIVADPDPLAIPDIVAALRKGLNRRSNQFWAPTIALRAALHLLGKSDDYERLAGALVAHSETLLRLGWRPPVETRSGLELFAASSVDRDA